MLTEKQIQDIVSRTGVKDFESLKNAIVSEEETTLELPELHVFKTEDLDELKSNSKKIGYEEGKVAGPEMLIKEGKEKFGLEFDGKSLDNFADALKRKTLADAKLEPDTRISELEKDKESLQSKLETIETSFNNYKAESDTKIKYINLNSQLLSETPNDLPKGFNPNDLVTLYRNNTEIVFEGDSPRIKIGDGVKKDDKLNPVNIKDDYKNFLIERGIGLKTPNGRGGGDEGGTGDVDLKSIDSMDKFEIYLSKKGISIASPQAAEILTEIRKHNKF